MAELKCIQNAYLFVVLFGIVVEMPKNKKAEYPEFYCCYLLRSLQSKHRNYVYIGTTPNPIQRLRQHNGEIAAGAHKTEKKRPWEMLLLVHGFPTSTAALQVMSHVTLIDIEMLVYNNNIAI